MKFRIFASVFTVAASTLILISSAQADTNLGQLGTGHDCGGADYTEIQTATGAAPRYVVPTDGVINSWSVEMGIETGVVTRLKMFRPTAAPNQFKLIGESANQAMTPSTVNSFPTSVPVQAGDLLGIDVVDGGGYDCLFGTADAGDVASEVLNDHSAVGDTVTITSEFTSTRVNVAATLGPPLPPTPTPTPVPGTVKKKCKKHKKKHSASSAKKNCKKKKKK